ncbi:MAG: serpin family protein [Clostridia bacterium]|nr:serpin family protein [Clostridia bacterium]
MKKLIAAILVLSLLFSFSACSKKNENVNLMKDIEGNKSPVDKEAASGIYLTDFAAALLGQCYEGENTLLSPLSVMCALAMVENGADGETKVQMEELFNGSCEDISSYLYHYCNTLPSGEKYSMSIANSIWIKNDESLTVNGDFLQKNADYFSADIYRSEFDKKAVKDINNWVSENTNEMIPEIVDSISPNAVMYLINALAFEAEWQDIYNEYAVREGDFTLESGKTKEVEFMYSGEGVYLEDENTTGFIKYYKDGKYAFVALLPDEDEEISDYVKALTGEKISDLLESSTDCVVRTSIPKFETEYSKSLTEILGNMGMTDAFDPLSADFSALGYYKNGNLYISDVMHKTYISVAEKGTRAGAATSISVNATGEPSIMEEPKEVYLDRPFVYMLIDCETETPFFIGVLTNP